LGFLFLREITQWPRTPRADRLMATGGGGSCAATGGKCADVVFEMVGGIMFPSAVLIGFISELT
jgi:hypothetical protein